MWRDVRMFLAGVVAGLTLALAVTAPAGELYNVKPYPQGTILVPGNIVFTIRLNQHDEQMFQCQPIVPRQQSIYNPENYTR